jgi:integrase
MSVSERHPCPVEETRTPQTSKSPGTWSAKYGAKHRLERVSNFPTGIVPPKRVRIYYRADHYVLQWWDPAAKGNLSDRVDGDLVAAITRARQVEERLAHFRSSGQGCRRLAHDELIDRFLQDLTRRADAAEIDTATVTRYRSALGHYAAFVGQPEIARTFPYAAGVNREFQLALAAFLSNRTISPNGHPNAKARTMRGPGFVEAAVRALFAWAADPDRGRLLPDGFRNPFLGNARRRRSVVRDLIGEPDVTTPMAVEFLLACDAFQLKLFGPMVLYGLRAAEPCFLFVEHVADGWLKIQCIDGLGYKTKGRRDKRFPLLPCVQMLWQNDLSQRAHGLFFRRRGVAADRDDVPLRDASLEQLEQEYEKRCGKTRVLDSARKVKVRGDILKDAGGLHYDHIQREFKKVTRQLGWAKAATVKDFRHLFCTLLENAGIPEYYRRYLMGHAPGKSAVVNYTHLNKVKQQFERAVGAEFGPLVEAIERRGRQLLLAR